MPIRWRLTLFNALAIGTILLLLGFSLHFLLRGALTSDIEDLVETRAESAAESIEEREDVSDLASGEEDADELTLDDVFIVVRDTQGNVLAQTTDLTSNEDSVWSEALASGEPASGTARLSEEAPDYVSAVPVRLEDGGPTVVVEAGKSYEDVGQTLADFRTVLSIGLGVAFSLAILGAYFLARAALSPVEAVTSAAREMTDGDLSRRLPVAHRKDELGRLTETINALLSRLEAALVRREEALARQRSFVADASHELRTPLTSIRGYSKMLEGWGLEDPGTARESAATIRRESERMRSLVEGLLALARGDEGAPMHPEPADLSAVADEVVQSARSAAGEKNVAVSCIPPEKGARATFDGERIREAISILLDNAVKYTPEGGKVTVRTLEEGGWAKVEVADTGVGVPEEKIPLIFERFYRADPARGGGGAGLGLPIARQIAEAHGGSIDVQSEPDVGSTFTLLLPKKREF